MPVFRAVPRSGVDSEKRHVRFATSRLPNNVPFVIDHLWEYFRSGDRPSLRHSVYTSPTEAIALENASADLSAGGGYVVCEVMAEESAYRVAQLPFKDAREHSDVKRLLQVLLQATGAKDSCSTVHDKRFLAPLFLPLLSKADMAELVETDGDLAQAVEAAGSASTFWTDAYSTLDPQSDGEVFFKLINGAHYGLRELA